MFEVGDTGKTLAELKHEGQDVPTHRIKAMHRLIAQLRPV
jgi:inosine/xanthosine triphosphate pyrophosphatase family protein